MKKTDNGSLDTKLKLRRYFLDKYHKVKKFSVMDCCAGSGKIWGSLRTEYNCVYCGLDTKSKNGRLKVKSERALDAGMVADVIDIDTYGAPWEHWFPLLPHIVRPTTVFLTIGSTHLHRQNNSAIEAAGITFEYTPPALLGKYANIITTCCIAKCYDHDILIVEAKEATHSHARYVGLRLRRKDEGDL